ncbi:MAG: acetyl-CoA carboxylase biotin carboxylase subunit [Oscillospiraceae bacterium]|nr:acetyl-CoA carboxylase biotin carboxylase subunit [Oscillospiraceae bacterium]
MFSKILIANRGEVAVRVIRACREMGIKTVAVYSKADTYALHTAMADQAVCIGEASSSDSYLNAERIVAAALSTGAQAIHPGYGFLSENQAFARLCEKYGLVFIGPGADIMDKLSDKEQAKRMMAQAGVPVIPGSRTVTDAAQALALAEELGYPVLLKAKAGGGGRGIRQVNGPEEMENAFATACAESLAAFGSGDLYMEKFIHPARHIEFQILADEAGNAVCLGERECSIQKNHQKLVEETPSPAVTEEKRQALIPKVLGAIRQIGYTNAGTLEFLMDRQGNFYFMEMNVRLQVEHTITEQITGVDIVKWQIRIAAGVELDFTQEQVRFNGVSIECRINARASGRVDFLNIPGGPFVRFDTFLWNGITVPPFYDPLIGKLIVWAHNREEAIRKMKAALCELTIRGLPTNTDEELAIVSSEDFSTGDYDTNFFENQMGS